MSKSTCRSKPHQHPRRQFVVRKKIWGTWGGSFFEPAAEGFLKRKLFIRDSGENHLSFAGFSDVVLKVLREVQTLAEAFKRQGTLALGLSATGKVKNEHHQSDDEQDVDERTGDLKSKSTAPEEQDENGDNEQHASESHLARLPVVRFVMAWRITL